jgi:hypothetical protein
MTNCTFRGFWQAVRVSPKGRASLTGCTIDLATCHTYPPEEEAAKGFPVVRACICTALQTVPIGRCTTIPHSMLATLLVWCMRLVCVTCRSMAVVLTPTCTWPAVS